MITTAIHSEPIDLGRQGENLVRTIEIDISAWRAEYGEGTVQLLHQRQGDSTPYPAAVEQVGDVVRWAITSADTARVGYGAAQLLFFAAGDVLAKQCIYRTCVSPSLGQSAGEPPEAQQPWVERVLAEAAKVTGMTARAVELPAGAEPTADYANGILTIGIPLGDVAEEQITQAVSDYLAAHPIQESDPTVPDWAKAAQKPSYTASEVGAIAQTELQAAVATALAEAKASGAFDGAPGLQGEQGSQGIQGETGPQGETGVGIQSVVQTTESTEDGGTNVVTVTKTDGTTSTFSVRNGSTGPAGADGKSAYQYAQDGGYTGTEKEFAVKLASDIPSVDSTLTQSGQAADAAAVGERLSCLSEEKVDKSVLGLIVGADGKIYVAINGVAIGSGVEITGGTGEDTTYKVELSDGIILNTLMFQDEFDGDGLSSTWKPAYGYDNAALNNWWTADEKNLGVSNGCVRLTMLRDNPTDNFAISAAKIETMQYGAAHNYGFDTGYCEVRFKLDKVGDGIWPAIWFVGQTQTDEYTDITATSVTRKIHGYTWPWAGEIDQLDGIGSAFTPGLIYQTDPYDSGILTMKGSQNVSLEADTWYTIGLYKTKDVIKVYWNRGLIDTFDISSINSFSGMGERLIINLSTGKSLGGILPDDVSEVNMFVDYVRVYSLSNDYTTLAEQNTATLLPDYADGFDCVSGRNFLLRPQFAENTKNTALYWTSSDTAVAKVENGYVTTVANGKCTIYATDANGNQVISFPLTVKADAGVLATKLKLVSNATSIGMGETIAIDAHIYPTSCDSLTPVLTFVSGSEYCTIDGLTITNTNQSGANQNVVIRVGTNNPDIYEDITLSMVGGIVDNIDTTGIVAKYTRNGWNTNAWAADIDSNPPLTTANSTDMGWVYTAGAGYMKGYSYGTAVNIGTDLFNIDGPFTILSRIYYAPGANISSGGNIIEVINDGGTNAGNIEVNAGQNRIYTKDATATNQQIASFFGDTSRDTTNGATYNVVLVKDESRNLTVYINGVQTAQSTYYSTVDPMGLTGIAFRFPKLSVTTAYYQAMLAYNRAMTAEEIVALHEALEKMYA